MGTPTDRPEEAPDLSVAIVCKNNRATIGRTLESVRGLAREVVAVDSGSTDGTIELLESGGATVIRSEWLGHVKTKQRALEACSCAWVLSLDSDESPEPELIESIRGFLESPDPHVDGARVNRRIWYQGEPLEHAWQPEWRLRLVRRGKAAWGGLDPHDKLDLLPNAGASVDLGGHLRHDSFERFADHLEAQAKHARTMARSLHNAGRGTGYLRPWISAVAAFVKQLLLRGSWRDGRAGWLAAYSSAIGAFGKHVCLLEMRSHREPGDGSDA
ncbi:MAG: glycosyltransferase family 2 protein [Planctomycetota bacterium]